MNVGPAAIDGYDVTKSHLYQTYVLRLWQVHLAGRPAWRASLESPHSGERLCFSSLDELSEYLKQETQNFALNQGPVDPNASPQSPNDY